MTVSAQNAEAMPGFFENGRLPMWISYLDLVFQDTPICDGAVFDAIKPLAASHEVSDRFERVRLFLDYLGREEEGEYSVIMTKSVSIPLLRPTYRCRPPQGSHRVQTPMDIDLQFRLNRVQNPLWFERHLT
jgi:hypothetical protein